MLSSHKLLFGESYPGFPVLPDSLILIKHMQLYVIIYFIIIQKIRPKEKQLQVCLRQNVCLSETMPLIRKFDIQLYKVSAS